MDRKRAIILYLSGTLGQMLITCIAVFALRFYGIKTDYTTLPGIAAIAMGGLSSALWGIIVSVKYKRVTLKAIFTDFFNFKKSYVGYAFVLLFLILDFCYVLFGGSFQITVWYMPVILFFRAIVFGGIEEIGWRYTLQPVLQEKINYVCSTLITFVSWGAWHFLYFYVEGSLYQVDLFPFLLGLLTNCFILSVLYMKTKSLWICVMTHALINVFSQISSGGSSYILLLCRIIIIAIAVIFAHNENKIKAKAEY
ncbi:MAG: type II CAAX endopeptidase family protein [Firmicutes bacterium]|nr:type II CAAX endopeptidase family protein [Bacillota bacterium]